MNVASLGSSERVPNSQEDGLLDASAINVRPVANVMEEVVEEEEEEVQLVQTSVPEAGSLGAPQPEAHSQETSFRTAFSRGETVSLIPENYIGTRDFVGVWFLPCQETQVRNALEKLGNELRTSIKQKIALRKLRREAEKRQAKIDAEKAKLARLLEEIKEKEEAFGRQLASSSHNVPNSGKPKCPVCKLTEAEIVLVPCGHTLCMHCHDVWSKVLQTSLKFAAPFNMYFSATAHFQAKSFR